MRLNKFLGEAGVCSRREADRLIEAGRVEINGVKATMGMQVADEDTVCVDGKKVSLPSETKVVYAYYKPIGVISTMAKDDMNSLHYVLNKAGIDKRLFPVGRLDMDSEGLMLLTNDGEMMNKILKTSENHEKEYVVRVQKEISDSFIKGMREGVTITDKSTGSKVTTRKCFVKKNGKYTFVIVLKQGLNRQIRRMCGAFGYEVKNLKRIRIMNVRINDLKPGEIRKLSDAEYARLKELCGISES